MVWKMVGFIQTNKNGWFYVCVFVYLWIMKPFKIAYSRVGSVHWILFFVKTETKPKLLFGSVFFDFFSVQSNFDSIFSIQLRG